MSTIRSSLDRRGGQAAGNLVDCNRAAQLCGRYTGALLIKHHVEALRAICRSRRLVVGLGAYCLLGTNRVR